MKNFFGENISPSKDMERHCDYEKKLRSEISQLESNPDESEAEKLYLNALKHFLVLLLKSKAEVASRLFK